MDELLSLDIKNNIMRRRRITQRVSLVMVVCFVLFAACRPKEEVCCDPYNPECPNYDPCLTVFPADASFDILIRLSKDNFYYPEDTTIWYPVHDTVFIYGAAGPVYFRAQSPYMDRYSWKIGADPRDFSDSLFYLSFFVNEGGVGDIPVRLAVANDTLGNCLASSEQRDTTWQSFFIKHVSLLPDSDLPPYPMNGSFAGYVDQDSSQFHEIEIVKLGALIRHFPDAWGEIPAFIAPKEMWIFPDGNPRGYGKLLDDYKTVVIDYEVRQDDGSWESHQFVGERVQ